MKGRGEDPKGGEAHSCHPLERVKKTNKERLRPSFKEKMKGKRRLQVGGESGKFNKGERLLSFREKKVWERKLVSIWGRGESLGAVFFDELPVGYAPVPGRVSPSGEV